MKYCKRCVIPDTRPGIKFNEEGICYPCLNAERKKTIDWEKRESELRELCNKHRKTDGSYDCIVTVSGGKDSYFQVHMMKNVMKMNPLLLNVQNFSWTRTGMENFLNMIEVFDCDCEALFLKRKTAKRMLKKGFEEYGSPTWYWDRAVYTWPLQKALEKKIPLVVYGENIAYEYGGPEAEETYSAKKQLENDVVKPIAFGSWFDDEITEKDFQPLYMPIAALCGDVEPIYLSYFYPWSGYEHYKKALLHGFKSLTDNREWSRSGFIENYDQIDSPGYLVHPWLKYPKYGHARATDVACYWIRDGLITRKFAIDLVRKHDHDLDIYAITDFCNFIGITLDHFRDVVEGLYNREIFKKVDGRWQLKHPIWEDAKDSA